MSPQFVDYDADGDLDLFTATFDGSPHVALRGPEGFAQPEHVLDARGRRVLLDQFWNYDSEAWENAGRGEAGGAHEGDQCISALAFDWDADGDLDLLLGDYHSGRLYRQMNEGERGAPRFSGVNVPVEVGGEEHAVPGGMTAPQLVDWDGDGLGDLVVGGFGDCWSREPGGGVWLLRNLGEPGAPEFDAPQELVPQSAKPPTEVPLRPDAGLYAQAADYDGDGDLDLLVGGYSWWKVAQPELTAEQEARADELVELVAGDRERREALMDAALEGAEDGKAALAALRATEQWTALEARLEAHGAELEALRPSEQRQAGVWLYERL